MTAVVSATKAQDRKPASKLRLTRVAKGWPQAVLAAKVGLNRRSLYQIESGQTKTPKLATRKALAKALGVSVSKLFG